MNIGFVVTTLGRLDPLRALLSSLEGQLGNGDHVVLVAQGAQDDVASLAAEFAERGVAVTAATSGRGASLGRNTGVAALPAGDMVVTFPNDNTTYPAGTVAALHAAVDDPSFRAGGFTSWDERGPKTTLPEPGTPLDKYNVWAIIEMGILLRRSLFDAVGGFDENMGPGSATPWQVAEGTDLLLRAKAHDPSLEQDFRWLPAAVHVDGISTGFGLNAAERRRKLRAYGRGTGHAFAKHGYPLWWRAAFAVAGLLYGIRNPKPITALDGWPMFVGRLEGALGRTFGQARMVSATR